MARDLSVVVAALDTYREVEELHRCIERQTVRRQLEVVIVCTTEDALNLPDAFCSKYPDVILIEGGEAVLLHEARYLGIVGSTAPFVVAMEDHCLPSSDCFENMLERLGEGWCGVGPAVRNGNTLSSVARAANYVAYGQWMGRERSGEVAYIAGHNSAFSRAVLLSRGEMLVDDLIATSLAQESLRMQGHRFYLETRAVMYHWEASYWWGTRRVMIPQGQALGALRARSWSFLRRLCYTALIPCLIAFRYLRALQTYWRNVGYRISPAELLYLFPIASVWSLAELAGYWTGGTRAFRTVSDVERNRSPFVFPGEGIALPGE